MQRDVDVVEDLTGWRWMAGVDDRLLVRLSEIKI